jgi:hypothetical protein
VKSLIFIFITLFSLCSYSQSNEIIVFSSSEDSDGYTQKDMDQRFLKIIEDTTVSSVKGKSEKYLLSQGVKNPKVKILSESNYFEQDNKKLAIVRLYIETSNQLLIYGIKGKELIRIACVRQTSEKIPISYGKCGDKIREVFGIPRL